MAGADFCKPIKQKKSFNVNTFALFDVYRMGRLSKQHPHTGK